MSEKFERKERRYLVEDVDFLLHHIWEHVSTYEVSTDYYDFIPARWSKGKKGPKVRVRTYDNGDSFVEIKYGENKKRKPVSKFLRKWVQKLDYLFTLQYTRTEYIERNYRVTVDTKLRIAQNNPIYALPKYVVEIKGEAPEWMIPPEEQKGWSKSKWALKSLTK